MTAKTGYVLEDNFSLKKKKKKQNFLQFNELCNALPCHFK